MISNCHNWARSPVAPTYVYSENSGFLVRKGRSWFGYCGLAAEPAGGQFFGGEWHADYKHSSSTWASKIECRTDKIWLKYKFSPFFVNFGRHPYKKTNPQWVIKSQTAMECAGHMKGVHQEAKSALKPTQETMKENYDWRKGNTQEYQIGD